MNKLPFNRPIFWKVFIVILVLVVLTFVVLFRFTNYQLTTADTYGSLVTALILAYLVHLWLLPSEYAAEEESEGRSEQGDSLAEAPREEPEDRTEAEKPRDSVESAIAER